MISRSVLSPIVAIAMFLAACTPVLSKPSGPTIAFARAAELKRTVNLSRWFGRKVVETDVHYAQYIQADEAAKIREMGFTAVRLPLAPPFLWNESDPSSLDKKRLSYLDDAIRRLRAANLSVIVDIHYKDRRRMERDPEYRKALVAHWGALAAHLNSTTDPNHVFLELMNEPRFIGREAIWSNFQQELYQAVRSAAPNHTIIATSTEYSDPKTLAGMLPIDDRNVIYTFHFYDPVPFAHQGAGFWPADIRTVSLPYPPSDAGCRTAELTAKDPQVSKHVDAYCSSRADRNSLRAIMEPAVSWANRHQAPLFVGEFGAVATIPSKDRLRWFSDVRSVFDGYGLAWGLWSWDDCYGLALKVDGACPAADVADGGQASWLRACTLMKTLGLTPGDCYGPRPKALRRDMPEASTSGRQPAASAD